MHKKAFTPDNSAMLLIDHQVGTMAWTHSHDINLVKRNALRLARIAKAVSMPVVLTASMDTTVDQIISELAIDWTSPNGKKLEAILDYR